jgi:hypothetical protein
MKHASLYPSADLLLMAGMLSEALITQQFEPHRATFLSKQLLAMETICRVFCRETFSLEEETQRSLDLLPAPQTVISEGLAMLAPSMIFTADEEQAWLAEHIYPVAGVEPLAVDWEFVRKISELPMDVQGNAAFLLRAGSSDQE